MPEEGKVIPVKVALRCRPLVHKEETEGCKCCVQFVDNEPQLTLGKDKTFTYDYVFAPEAPQAEVYQTSVSKLVNGLFKGYNATVLAYGQTGSGKTFTMGGGYGECTDPEDEVNGVIPRVIRDLFKGVEERTEEYDITLRVSYIELYKEDLHDLLQSASRREPLHIREEAAGGIKLVGLTEQLVHDTDEMLHCLASGASGRTTGATAMNAQSSRSHAIFTVHMERKSKIEQDDLCRAKFHLVDLAGSERVKKTQAEGERFKEGVNINKGLLALGNVISALGEDGQKRNHIPYRDSKLTRLLQDSLGGNSHTVMIACISPADSNMEETLSTLRYADRARKIKNKPVVNRDPQVAEIMRLRQLVQDLQVQMVPRGLDSTSTSSVVNGSGNSSGNTESLKALREKYEELEEEKYGLQKELRVSYAQNHVLTEQNIHLEISYEKVANLLTSVKEKTGMSISRMETTQSRLVLQDIEEEDEDGDEKEDDKESHLTMMMDIHNQITEAEKDDVAGLGQNEDRPKSTEFGDDSMTDEEQLSRQADFQRRLVELNDKLHEKQNVVKQMLQNDEAMDAMKKKYEADKGELGKQIDKLNSERETLLQELQNAKHTGGTAAIKLSEQRRKRLKELEEELSKTRRTMRDQSKVVKMKEQSDHQLKKMTEDIKQMKQNRVKLLKQMKEEADRFRQWKQAKDKEVIQLKAKDRKRQLEMAKLQRTNEKQQSVFRRKAEEASAANKRLREALSRQKAVQDERNKKQEINNSSGIGTRVRKWLSQELEVLISVQEAKSHLDVLKQDRTDIARQIKAAKERLDHGPSPSKKRLSSEGKPKSTDKHEEDLRKEINMLEGEIELRSAQIADLQEKVMDAGQEEKTKCRWQNVHTMVEAKCAMKYLMDEAVSAKVEEGKQRSKVVDTDMKCDDLQKQSETLNKNLAQARHTHDHETLAVRKEYENKVLYLLNQLKNADNTSNIVEGSRDEELKERLKFQEQEIEKYSGLHEELEVVKTENHRLKEEVKSAHCVLPSTVRPTKTKKSPCAIEESRFFSPALLKTVKTEEIDDSSEESEGEEAEDEDEEYSMQDPDWVKTPLTRPPKRRTLTIKNNSNRASSEADWISPPKMLQEEDFCECTGTCYRCPCKKNKHLCVAACGCVKSKCRNWPISEEPEPDEVHSVLDSTYNITDDTSTALSDESTDVLKDSNRNTSATTKQQKASSSSSSVLLKENSVSEEQDTLNGGLKKKRKLMSQNKAYFGPLQS